MSSARSSRIVLAWIACLALAALAASCARQLPTAAVAARSPRSLASRTADHLIDQEVVVTLVGGALPGDVAATYGASVQQFDADQRVASFLPAVGDDSDHLRSELENDPRVATSESNVLFEPSEARQKSFAFDDGRHTLDAVTAQPAFEAVHAAQGRAISRGDMVRVAILDTGIDPSHPLFAGRIVAARDFIEGHDGATDEAEGVDTNQHGYVDGAWGHGTHVAGIVATIAPGAQLVIGRVLDSDGVGDVVTVAAGIRWAVASGARVINLSLGSLSASSAIADALEEAEEQGVLVFASAGNWGAALPQEYPASAEEVAAVAASDAYGNPAPWSSYASYVALSAPGVAIRSAYPGSTYRLWSGTSMSTPFVSGAAALVLSQHASWSRSAVLRRITGNARPLTNLAGDRAGMFGTGMLDIGRALRADTDSDEQVVAGPQRPR